MNRDDIVRLAQEAGWWQPLGLPSDWEEGDYVVSPEQMLRFAALVAAAERESCAKIADQLDDMTGREIVANIRTRGLTKNKTGIEILQELVGKDLAN